MRFALLVFALILISGTGRSRAEVSCSPLDTCSASPTDAESAKQCLCVATRFFDDVAAVVALPFTAFDQILPPLYEGSAGKYSDALLDEVIAWAASATGTDPLLRDELLYEASFRKASAHGMFGDDALFRGLDPRSGGVQPDRVIAESRQRLDSRVCHAAVPTDEVCNTDADCAPGETCRARRFGPAAPRGAVQEYRRAEQALVFAIQRLGVDRFRQLDELQPRCLGSGCAARLLVRLGAMKARAQAERVDLLWRRAVASGGVSTDSPSCSAGRVGQFCSVHADCDVGGSSGHCGTATTGAPAFSAHRSGVLLREAVGEALAEAAVAQALYASLLPPGALAESSDWSQLQASLSRLADVESRSTAGVTPFGIPADYVPLLSSVQEGYLDCLSNCGTACDQVSNTLCLAQLASGPGFLNLLADARTQQENALASAAEFANTVKLRGAHAVEMRDDFVRVIERMLGTPCTACSCSAAEQEAGRCAVFDNKIWIIQGVVCDEPSAPDLACELAGVDGEIERQILAIRNAELALENVRRELVRNTEGYERTLERFAELNAIQAEQCADAQAAISNAGSDVNSAISQLEQADGSGAQAGQGVAELVGSAAAVGASILPGPGALIGVGTSAIIGGLGKIFGIGGSDKQKKQQQAQAQLQRALARIQTEKELEFSRIRCRAEKRILQVGQADALFEVETQRQRLLARELEQIGALLDSLVHVQQLQAELAAAARRFGEATQMRAVWDAFDGGAFRNPANYRSVALAKQLAGADAFRSAQVLTWMILRSVAYDLARPDFELPQTFESSQVLQLSGCRKSRCSMSGGLCSASDECPGGAADLCVVVPDPGVEDSRGGCSLQAVFAARTIDDLESLIDAALLQLVASDRTLACQGSCVKHIRLRNLFTSTRPPAGQSQPILGDVLLELPRVPGFMAVVNFGISPKRGFELCPFLPDGSSECQAAGVANLSKSDEDGFGDLSTNVWNARMLSVKGVIEYDPARDPGQRLCRNFADGEVVNPAFDCSLLGETAECPHLSPPPGGTGCFEAGGTTPAPCRCLTLLKVVGGTVQKPVVSLHQLEPGVVRTAAAEIFVGPGVVRRDRFIRYQMRRNGTALLLGEVPQLETFGVPSLTLFPDEATAVPQPNVKGVPVASARWQLRLAAGQLQQEAWVRAFIGSIRDIELILTYQGFDL